MSMSKIAFFGLLDILFLSCLGCLPVVFVAGDPGVFALALLRFSGRIHSTDTSTCIHPSGFGRLRGQFTFALGRFANTLSNDLGRFHAGLLVDTCVLRSLNALVGFLQFVDDPTEALIVMIAAHAVVFVSAPPRVAITTQNFTQLHCYASHYCNIGVSLVEV